MSASPAPFEPPCRATVRGQILALAWKELVVFFRDPPAVILVFLMPLAFVVLMSLALASQFGSVDERPIVLMAVDEDGGPAAGALLRRLGALPSFQLERSWAGRPLDRSTAERLVAEGERSLAVIVPAGLGEILAGPAREPPGEVLLVVEPTVPGQVVEPLLGTLRGLVERARAEARAPREVDALFDELKVPALVDLAELRARAQASLGRVLAAADRPPVGVRRVSPAGQEKVALPDTYQQNVPSYTLFGIFWIVVLLAESVLQERRGGTFRRLRTAPMGRSALLLGKLLPFLVINLLQVTLMLGAARLLFGMSLGRSPAALLAVSLAASLAAVGLGVLVSALGRTEARARNLTILVLLLLAALGGCFIPRFVMPPAMQSVGLLTPHAWALEAYQDILVRGGDLAAVAPEVGVLLGFAALFFGLGVWRFRFEIEGSG
jgi:ABC-2 type transport system permease protein